MLEELLRLLQDGNTHNVLELSEILGDDAEGILSKLDFLEKQGYIRKVSLAGFLSASSSVRWLWGPCLYLTHLH